MSFSSARLQLGVHLADEANAHRQCNVAVRDNCRVIDRGAITADAKTMRAIS